MYSTPNIMLKSKQIHENILCKETWVCSIEEKFKGDDHDLSLLEFSWLEQHGNYAFIDAVMTLHDLRMWLPGCEACKDQLFGNLSKLTGYVEANVWWTIDLISCHGSYSKLPYLAYIKI